MRTGLFLLAGFLLVGATALLSRLFAHDYPSAPTVATASVVLLWLAITLFNMWVGVSKAGYSVSEELPILLLLFGLPAIAAVLLRWKVL